MGASCTCLNQTKEKTDYILDSNRAKEIGKQNKIFIKYKVNEISKNRKLLFNLIRLQSRFRGIISRKKVRHLVKGSYQFSGNYNSYKPVMSSNTRIVN